MKTNLELVYKKSQKEIINTEKQPVITVNDFDEKNSRTFLENILKIKSDSENLLIPIIIDSYGGQVYSLLSMLDILHGCSLPIVTIGIGKAMSCGAVLLAAGTKGNRYAAPNIDILIHEVSTFTRGKNSDIQNEAKNTERLNTLILKKLAFYCNKSDSYFIDMMKNSGNVDLYLTAKEAKKLGLVDHIGVPFFYTK